MIDDWEECEHLDYENIVTHILNVPNKEQIKQFEEKKLIEKSDNVFVNENICYNTIVNNINNINNINIIDELTNVETDKKENKLNQKENKLNQKENELNQKENELNQKEISITSIISIVSIISIISIVSIVIQKPIQK